MGRLLPFRRRRRWTRRRDFAAPRKLHFWPQDDPRHWTVRGFARETVQWLGRLRPFILGGILLSIWPALDPALVEPPGFLRTDPEPVAETFTRCGRGRGHACVVDGDTFRLDERRIRIIGIDTPEVDGRCEAERQLAEAATAELQHLLNQGPFTMVGRIDGTGDRYGRELRSIERKRPDGTVQSIGAEMRGSGLARRYLGGLRDGWC